MAKVTKAQIIRDYASKNPDASIKDIIKALGYSYGDVYCALIRNKNKTKSKTKTSSKMLNTKRSIISIVKDEIISKVSTVKSWNINSTKKNATWKTTKHTNGTLTIIVKFDSNSNLYEIKRIMNNNKPINITYNNKKYEMTPTKGYYGPTILKIKWEINEILDSGISSKIINELKNLKAKHKDNEKIQMLEINDEFDIPYIGHAKLIAIKNKNRKYSIIVRSIGSNVTYKISVNEILSAIDESYITTKKLKALGF